MYLVQRHLFWASHVRYRTSAQMLLLKLMINSCSKSMACDSWACRAGNCCGQAKSAHLSIDGHGQMAHQRDYDVRQCRRPVSARQHHRIACWKVPAHCAKSLRRIKSQMATQSQSRQQGRNLPNSARSSFIRQLKRTGAESQIGASSQLV